MPSDYQRRVYVTASRRNLFPIACIFLLLMSVGLVSLSQLAVADSHEQNNPEIPDKLVYQFEPIVYLTSYEIPDKNGQYNGPLYFNEGDSEGINLELSPNEDFLVLSWEVPMAHCIVLVWTNISLGERLYCGNQQNQQYHSAVISPSGEYIAACSSMHGRWDTIVILDVSNPGTIWGNEDYPNHHYLDNRVLWQGGSCRGLAFNNANGDLWAIIDEKTEERVENNWETTIERKIIKFENITNPQIPQLNYTIVDSFDDYTWTSGGWKPSRNILFSDDGERVVIESARERRVGNTSYNPLNLTGVDYYPTTLIIDKYNSNGNYTSSWFSLENVTNGFSNGKFIKKPVISDDGSLLFGCIEDGSTGGKMGIWSISENGKLVDSIDTIVRCNYPLLYDEVSNQIILTGNIREWNPQGYNTRDYYVVTKLQLNSTNFTFSDDAYLEFTDEAVNTIHYWGMSHAFTENFSTLYYLSGDGCYCSSGGLHRTTEYIEPKVVEENSSENPEVLGAVLLLFIPALLLIYSTKFNTGLANLANKLDQEDIGAKISEIHYSKWKIPDNRFERFSDEEEMSWIGTIFFSILAIGYYSVMLGLYLAGMVIAAYLIIAGFLLVLVGSAWGLCCFAPFFLLAAFA